MLTVQMSPWVGRVPWKIVHGPSVRASFTLSALEPSKSYFLRARCGTGPWSAVSSLRTEGDGDGTVGGVSDELLLQNPTCPVFHGPRAALVVTVGAAASPVGVPRGTTRPQREIDVRGEASRDLADALRGPLGFDSVVHLVDPPLAVLKDAIIALGRAHGSKKLSGGHF
jgi:hypothetical protein